MKHVHFFEFEDLHWLPELFRNMITQITQYNLNFFKIYDPIFSKIEHLLKITGKTQIIDLCSGSSGIWPRLISQIESPIKVILTDKYPNIVRWKEVAKSSGGRICYCRTAVKVPSIPNKLKGLYTIFTGFHHFSPDEAKQILRETVAQNEPIAIFEFTEKNFPSIFRALWLYFWLPFFETPFIKPRTFTRFLWTYLIPIVPILHWWDGVISNLRSYSIAELWDIVSSIDWKKFHWEIGTEQVKSYGMKGKITYLIGYPK